MQKFTEVTIAPSSVKIIAGMRDGGVWEEEEGRRGVGIAEVEGQVE